MAFIIKKNLTDAEWLQERTHGIGSSEVGTIMGVNPYETPLELWRKKLGIDPPTPVNEAMTMGHLLEEAVSQRWQMETGFQVIKSSVGNWLMVDAENPHLRVSPDRTYWLPGEAKNNSNKGILECKTTMLDIDSSNIPFSWFLQLQYQLGVAGYKCGHLAWLKMGRTFGYQAFDFDPDTFKDIREAVDEFWFKNIKEKIQPDPVNVSDELLINPRHTDGKKKEITEELLGKLEALKEVKENIASLNTTKEQFEAELKMFMEDAEALTLNGKTLCTWKAGKDREDFDKKRFAAECPDQYAQYCSLKPASRTFLIK